MSHTLLPKTNGPQQSHEGPGANKLSFSSRRSVWGLWFSQISAVLLGSTHGWNNIIKNWEDMTGSSHASTKNVQNQFWWGPNLKICPKRSTMSRTSWQCFTLRCTTTWDVKKTLQTIGWTTYQVVRDFFHQQHHPNCFSSDLSINTSLHKPWTPRETCRHDSENSTTQPSEK